MHPSAEQVQEIMFYLFLVFCFLKLFEKAFGYFRAFSYPKTEECTLVNADQKIIFTEKGYAFFIVFLNT